MPILCKDKKQRYNVYKELIKVCGIKYDLEYSDEYCICYERIYLLRFGFNYNVIYFKEKLRDNKQYYKFYYICG